MLNLALLNLIETPLASKIVNFRIPNTSVTEWRGRIEI